MDRDLGFQRSVALGNDVHKLSIIRFLSLKKCQIKHIPAYTGTHGIVVTDADGTIGCLS